MSHLHKTQTFEYEIALVRKTSLCRKYKFLGNSSEGLKIGLSATQLKSDWVDSLKYICINLPRFARQAGWKRKSQIQCESDKTGEWETRKFQIQIQENQRNKYFIRKSQKSQIHCESDKRKWKFQPN